MANKTNVLDGLTITDFLSAIDTFLLDCDGVLWMGNTSVPGVPESLEFLRGLNKRLIFVTNNSTKSRLQIQKKVQSFGIECKKEEVFGSAYAAGAYLSSINFKKKAYIVGEESIAAELTEFGINYRGVDEHALIPKSLDDVVQHLEVDPEVGAVVVGLDPKFAYTKLAVAHQYLTKDKNCLFLATNTDALLPIHGKTLPGSGSIVNCLATSTGRSPIVLGKPSQTFLKLIIQSCNIDPKMTCMVGDRLETDIQFGIDGGLISTLLVLTGVTPPDWPKACTDKGIFPSHVVPSIGDLPQLWKGKEGKKSKL